MRISFFKGVTNLFLIYLLCVLKPVAFSQTVDALSDEEEPVSLKFEGCDSNPQESLIEWRDLDFETDQADAAATMLVDCLKANDPFLRDKIGFEGFTELLRKSQVSKEVQRSLTNTLLQRLVDVDPHGIAAPFAALGLSELARSDRINEFLTVKEREALIFSANDYLNTLTDYRGYDESEGWRHGVAHGADLIMQIMLNPQVDLATQRSLRESISRQLAPTNGHSYIFNEPERLARPILYMAARGDESKENWENWFKRVTDPAPLISWSDAFTSELGLARRHNIKAFLLAIYLNSSLTKNPKIQILKDMALDGLKRLN